MKRPVCDDAIRDTGPDRRGRFARTRPRRAPHHALLTVLLVAGLIGLAAVAGHRHYVAAQARQQRLDAQRAAFDTEAEDAPTDDAQAVKRDAQGDQAPTSD